MDPALAAGGAPAPHTFHDGLGERRRSSDATGGEIELLCLRRQLTSIPSFEFALRERASRLASFRHTYFGRVRSIDRLNDPASTLAVVSDVTRGVRLSQLLTPTESRPVAIDINAGLHLLRQLVSAVAMLHENAPDVAHGAIGPERIVVTSSARVVIVEYVLGAALEQLHYSQERYWQELRIALPPSAGTPRFDQRADVTELGVVALSLVLGRLLTDDEYPARVSQVLASAWGRSNRGGDESLPPGLRTWLGRALQLDPRHSFASALDARVELDRVLDGEDEGDYQEYEAAAPAPDAVKPADVWEPYAPVPQEIVMAADPSAVASVTEPTPVVNVIEPKITTAPEPKVTTAPEPKMVAEPAPFDDAWGTPVAAPLDDARDKPKVPAFFVRDPKPVARPAVELEPIAATLEPITPPAPAARAASPNPAWDPNPYAAGAAPSPLTPIDSFTYESDDEAPMTSRSKRTRPWTRFAAAAAALLVLSVAGVYNAKRFLPAPKPLPVVPSTGVLTVVSNPAGAQVFIDNTERGTTPLALTLAAGSHIVELHGAGEPRTMPVTVAAGAQISQYIELPTAAPAATGSLQIRTEPAGAQVSVDGAARGKSPLLVDGLTPGDHMVVVSSDLGEVKHRVVVQAATTAALVVPLGAAAEGAPVSGWVSLAAPAELLIYENKRLLGTSKSDRIMLAAGRHELEIVSDALGYRASTIVQVSPGKVAPIKLEWPKGTIALNALPWAEVWIDGEKSGETPIGNLPIGIGLHEIIFRHPDLGEQRHAVTVSLGVPARLSVDLRKEAARKP